LERKIILMAFVGSVFAAIMTTLLVTPAVAETTDVNSVLDPQGVGHNPYPGMGIRIDIRLGPLVQYVSTLDYSYVLHGWRYGSGWSLRSESWKTQWLSSHYFTLETNAPGFEQPALSVSLHYDDANDTMTQLFLLQFYPGNLSPGAYSFTGKFFSNYVLVNQRTISLVVTHGYYLTVRSDPLSLTTIPGEGDYDAGAVASLEAPPVVPVSTGVQYRFDYWAVDGNIVIGNPITVCMDAFHNAIAHYVQQYYLTVVSDYDTSGGEGWYDEGETAYATVAIGLYYVDTLAYGFVGWSGDSSGWDLISEPIIMNAPKTAIATWESSSAYGDVRTIVFWKCQANIWYFTERARTDLKIRGIGTANISEDVFIACLTFIDSNSDYFSGKIAKDNNGDGTTTNLEILQNAYNFLKTPTGADSIKMRAEQQLLALWLNLAYKAFFWNTQLSQNTIYIYYQYNLENEYGLTTIGEAIEFCEAELLKSDANFEAAKNVCNSINSNLGIIWGT